MEILINYILPSYKIIYVVVFKNKTDNIFFFWKNFQKFYIGQTELNVLRESRDNTEIHTFQK